MHRQPRLRPRRRSLALLVMLAGYLPAAGGCETATQDLTGLFEGWMAPAPRVAAEWMFDRDPDRRRRGVNLLAASPFGGVDVYVRAYADIAANDEDPIARAAAVRALARHGGPEHAPILARQLEHESVHVRWEAAKGLQRLHNPAVIDRLVATLVNADADADVRAAAAYALGQYPEDRVFQALLSAMEARELRINENALASLETLTGQSFGFDTGRWLSWYRNAEDPFAGGGEYVYKTYARDETLLETMAFWTENNWEEPAPPAGLPGTTDRTYPSESTERGG